MLIDGFNDVRGLTVVPCPSVAAWESAALRQSAAHLDVSRAKRVPGGRIAGTSSAGTTPSIDGCGIGFPLRQGIFLPESAFSADSFTHAHQH